MPNRILRAPIRQSQRWNALNFFSQSLYIRILTLVDDYGRYEAHPQLLANECFPYGDDKGEPVSRDAVEQSLQCICSANMAVLYEYEGKKLLQLLRWKEHARTDSKFPECPKEALNSKCCANAVQMITSPPSPSPTPSLSGDAPRNGKLSGAETVKRDGELRRVREKIQTITRRYNPGQRHSDKDRDELAKLKAREKELLDILDLIC